MSMFKKRPKAEQDGIPAKDIAMAYALRKRQKKMAKGGAVDRNAPGPAERMFSGHKGVHEPIPEYKGQGKMSYGNSGMKSDSMETKKRRAKQVLEEQRAMPKPNIEGLAEGGPVKKKDRLTPMAHSPMVKSDIVKGRMLKPDGTPMDDENTLNYEELRKEFALKKKQMKRMAEGGEVNEVLPLEEADEMLEEHPADLAMDDDMMRPDQDEYMADHAQMLAEGGELEEEHHASIASAIMAKRRRMAEGGEVDIESNGQEEDANAFDQLNEDAALKENYDSDLMDVSQPENSNEHGDMPEMEEENKLDSDMVSKIRRKMKKRSPITE